MHCSVSGSEWENGERTGSDIFSPLFLVLRLLIVDVTVTIAVACEEG